MIKQTATNPCTQPVEALISRIFGATAYPYPTAGLQMIETRLSWVFPAGEFAYEVRKLVRLNFVDFSTLLAWQINHEEECRLSRCLVPALYLGAVPVSNNPTIGAIRIDGQDMPGEYAVCMCRFIQRDTLTASARDGRFRPKEIGTLADLIVNLRATAPVASTGSGNGTPSGIRRTFENCVAGAIALGHAPLSAAAMVSLLRQHTVRLEKMFASRRRSRHIHERHGDLHLGSIVLIDDQPTPSDYLEFSPSLQWIGTMYGTAFLFINLLAAGLDGSTYRLINRYLERCGDHGGLAALPFYAAMCTLVRARVLLKRAHRLGGAPGETTSLRGEANRMLTPSQHLFYRGNVYILLMHDLLSNGKSTRAA